MADVLDPQTPSQGALSLRNIEPDDGFWRSCSGCHETIDGQETGWYPFSPLFKCYLGAGCRECGGLGAVWDDIDYAAMAEHLTPKAELRDARDQSVTHFTNHEQLWSAAKALHDDMLERARLKVDVIHGEEHRVVNAGNGAWSAFCAALEVEPKCIECGGLQYRGDLCCPVCSPEAREGT